MTDFTFVPATKTQAKARVALAGPSGSGKTYTALAIAQGLAGEDGRIAVIDTEHGSASKYADRFGFDVLNLETFAPVVYVQAIKAAEAAGYDVIVIDSLSHEWAGTGGALEMVDALAAREKSANTFAAWRKVTPEHTRFIDTIIRCRAHVIATMRTKTDYVLETNARGKQVPRKVGLAPIQRAEMDYEFDVVAELDLDHTLVVTKTRCPDLDGVLMSRPDGELGRTLAAWLSDGDQEILTAQSEAGAVVTDDPAPRSNGHAPPVPDAIAPYDEEFSWRVRLGEIDTCDDLRTVASQVADTEPKPYRLNVVRIECERWIEIGGPTDDPTFKANLSTLDAERRDGVRAFWKEPQSLVALS